MAWRRCAKTHLPQLPVDSSALQVFPPVDLIRSGGGLDAQADDRRLWLGILATLLMPFFGLGGLVLLVAVIVFERSTAKEVQRTAAGPPAMRASCESLLLASVARGPAMS
jgi:hypothetical protein